MSAIRFSLRFVGEYESLECGTPENQVRRHHHHVDQRVVGHYRPAELLALFLRILR